MNVFDLGARKNFQAVFGVGRCAALLALFTLYSFPPSPLFSALMLLAAGSPDRCVCCCLLTCHPFALLCFLAADHSSRRILLFCARWGRFALEWLMPGDPDIGTCALRLLARMPCPGLRGFLLACLCR